MNKRPAVAGARRANWGLKKNIKTAAQTLYVDLWRGFNKRDAKASVNKRHDHRVHGKGLRSHF